MVVEGRDRELTQGANDAFVGEGFDDQIRVNAFDPGGIDEAIGQGDQRAKVNPLGAEFDTNARPLFPGRGQCLFALVLQAAGLFPRQQLDQSAAEQMVGPAFVAELRVCGFKDRVGEPR